jgi:hypothetical protein
MLEIDFDIYVTFVNGYFNFNISILIEYFDFDFFHDTLCDSIIL